jgi:NAD-dependent deacetylase
MDADFVLDPELVRLLRRAQRVVALTGAGISAESGVPTFRDAQQGLWAQYDPSELATPEGFARNPKRVWDWYALRRELIGRVEPNAGHRALARWEVLRPDLLVVTQNVDGLHQRAGSSQVIELHGNIMRTKCSLENVVVDQWEARPDEVPRCGQCAAYLRPDVVWFGEMLPVNALATAERAVAEVDLVLSVGTSSLVQPAASLPYGALAADVPVVEINPEETPLTADVHYSLRGSAGRILPLLVEAARG